MSITVLSPGLQPHDYDSIEAALLETARGRWFLQEHARRRRGDEIAQLKAALERLERKLAAQEAGAAARLAEKIQDFAWTLRERGVDESVCAKLDALAREACGAAQPMAETGGGWEERGGLETGEAAPAAAALPMAQTATGGAKTPWENRFAALARLDQLPLEERLKLFS